MPGTETLGKLFFKLFFLRDLAARTRCSRKANRRDKHRGTGAFIVSRRPRLEPACAKRGDGCLRERLELPTLRVRHRDVPGPVDRRRRRRDADRGGRDHEQQRDDTARHSSHRNPTVAGAQPQLRAH